MRWEESIVGRPEWKPGDSEVGVATVLGPREWWWLRSTEQKW